MEPPLLVAILQELTLRALRRGLFLAVAGSAELGCGIAGNLPAREDQDCGMALQGSSENLGSLDAKPDAIILDGRECRLGDARQLGQLVLAVPL